MRNKLRIIALTLLALWCVSYATAQDSVKAKPTPTDYSKIPMLNYTTAPVPYIVNNVTVEGVEYLNPSIVASTSGLVKGDTILMPSDFLSSAIRKMWNQRYFSDVQILTETVGDSVNIKLVLVERPMVYRWKFEGVGKGIITELTEKLNLKKASEFSDFKISTNAEAIRKFFREKGFLNVDVQPRFENDSIRKNAVNVTYVVKKNERVRIGEISFEGNDVISDRKLRKSFKKTHQKGINIFKSSKFKEKEYETDKENLLDYFNSKGYRNAMITSDTVYSISPSRLGIKLVVSEGNKYYYRNISWMGNSIYETDVLNQMLAIQKGEAYDKKALHKRLGIGSSPDAEDLSVSSLYQNAGYLFSQIEAAETIVGADSLDLNIKIFEGKPATVNAVTITGNLRVDDNVIRRELDVRPGMLYDRSMLMSTLRLLSSMQHFNPEAISPDIKPISNELVNIGFILEEQASDKFEISGGWGANMFVGSVGVQLNNVSIKNFFKKDAWRPYPAGQNQQLVIRGQTNGSYYKSISLSFTEPWLGGKKPRSLTVSTYYSDETDAYYIFQKSSKHFRTIGFSTGLGRRLSWPDRAFTLYNEIGYQAYNLKDWTAFLMENGTANILTFKTIFGRSTVDQPIYPRSGSDFSISLTLTPPYSLFQKNIDYSDPKLEKSDLYRWIEFHKWNLKGQWFYALDASRKMVLMAKAEMGYIGSYDKHKISPFEGFDLGGDGMSGYNVYGVDIIGLRGYENGALTPYSPGGNNYAKAYNKYTMELRYPIILKPSSTIYGIAFAEAGNAFASWKEFDPFLLKRSLGVGVRLYLPIVGMIGVDWGYGFDKAVGERKRSGSQIHFMIGNQF